MKHFGDLAYIRGIVYFIMSPHEQKPFAGTIKYGIPNFVTRARPTIRYWLPTLVLGCLIYKGVEEKYRLNMRKNWRDYLGEVPPPEPEEPEPEPESESKSEKECVKKVYYHPTPPPEEVDECCPKMKDIVNVPTK